jgi:hypothetical protein
MGVRTFQNSTVVWIEHTTDFVWDIITWAQDNTTGEVEVMPVSPYSTNKIAVLFEKPEEATLFALVWG